MGEAKRKTVFVAELDMDELALRLAEVAMGLKRPPCTKAAEALADMDRTMKAQGQPEMVGSFRRMAVAAAEYLTESVRGGHRPS